MSLGVVLQDPHGTSPHSIQWATYLNGAAISSAVWSVSPAGPTFLPTSAGTINGTITTVFLAGVEAEEDYELTCQITASNGAVQQRSITVRGGQQ